MVAAAVAMYVLGVDLDEDPLAVDAALRRGRLSRNVLWMTHRTGLERGRAGEIEISRALAKLLVPNRRDRIRFLAGARSAEARHRLATRRA